jgi:hypothetical protein
MAKVKVNADCQLLHVLYRIFLSSLAFVPEVSVYVLIIWYINGFKLDLPCTYIYNCYFIKLKLFLVSCKQLCNGKHVKVLFLGGGDHYISSFLRGWHFVSWKAMFLQIWHSWKEKIDCNIFCFRDFITCLGMWNEPWDIRIVWSL